MPLPMRRPSTKMDIAITLLQHLAILATYEGDLCAKVLFGTAEYLQDVLHCSPALGCDGNGPDQHALLQTLMTALANGGLENSAPLHS